MNIEGLRDIYPDTVSKKTEYGKRLIVNLEPVFQGHSGLSIEETQEK